MEYTNSIELIREVVTLCKPCRPDCIFQMIGNFKLINRNLNCSKHLAILKEITMLKNMRCQWHKRILIRCVPHNGNHTIRIIYFVVANRFTNTNLDRIHQPEDTISNGEFTVRRNYDLTVYTRESRRVFIESFFFRNLKSIID